MQTNATHPHCRRNAGAAPMSALCILLVVVTVTTTLAPVSPAQATARRTDKREIDARQAFASGKYQDALDLYAGLYADKVHPTYLRNIGRCYQNLKQPEKAINAFRDYLRQAKGLSPAERAEVDVYIAEMEQMKLQQEEAAKTSAAAAVVAQPKPTPLPTGAAANTNPAPAGADLVVVQPIPLAPPPPTPFYKKAWFWSVVGVAVAAGVVGGLYAGGAFSKSSITCTALDGCN
jgi:hypothetical protein